MNGSMNPMRLHQSHFEHIPWHFPHLRLLKPPRGYSRELLYSWEPLWDHQYPVVRNYQGVRYLLLRWLLLQFTEGYELHRISSYWMILRLWLHWLLRELLQLQLCDYSWWEPYHRVHNDESLLHQWQLLVSQRIWILEWSFVYRRSSPWDLPLWLHSFIFSLLYSS